MTKDITKIVLPDAGRMISGMRDTGYLVTTAIADLVDNSISANARNVSVQIDELWGDRITVSVVDDGHGMTLDDLEEAMRYGSKVRDNLNSLGKFGLGLKTASSAFAQKFSAISRVDGMIDSSANRATWDLEHVSRTGTWELQFGEASEAQLETLNSVTHASGTLIQWEVVDRLLSAEELKSEKRKRNALNRLERDLSEHIGLVFHRFINSNSPAREPVVISVNGKAVEAWDPFCESEPETEKVIDKKQEVELEDGSRASFHIRGFVIPRKEQYSSKEAELKARVGNDGQGFYIFREDRLIHGPDWLRMFSKEPHMSLARIELSFDYKLDSLFNVDIKKSRILLNETIAEFLKSKVSAPVRDLASKRYRDGKDRSAQVKALDIHSSSNSIMGQYDEDIVDNEIIELDQNKGLATLRTQNGTGQVRLLRPDEAKDDQPYVMTFETLLEGLLWEPVINKENRGVALNSAHPFYQKVYLPGKQTDITIQSFDYLIYALAMGEMNTINEKMKIFFEDLRRNVSKNLRLLSERLPEVDIDEE